jgi:hypothetical protein
MGVTNFRNARDLVMRAGMQYISYEFELIRRDFRCVIVDLDDWLIGYLN